MKIRFRDTEAALYEPHLTFRYKDRDYRCFIVRVMLDDGSIESHVIAEKDLETALIGGGNEDWDADEMFSYYYYPGDMVYSILEEITGEEVK